MYKEDSVDVNVMHVEIEAHINSDYCGIAENEADLIVSKGKQDDVDSGGVVQVTSDKAGSTSTSSNGGGREDEESALRAANTTEGYLRGSCMFILVRGLHISLSVTRELDRCQCCAWTES